VLPAASCASERELGKDMGQDNDGHLCSRKVDTFEVTVSSHGWCHIPVLLGGASSFVSALTSCTHKCEALAVHRNRWTHPSGSGC
jgi:hypothetical protein